MKKILKFFEAPTLLHRLQRFPSLALNSLERSETMLTEFYAPDYLYKLL